MANIATASNCILRSPSYDRKSALDTTVGFVPFVVGACVGCMADGGDVVGDDVVVVGDGVAGPGGAKQPATERANVCFAVVRDVAVTDTV